MLGFRLFRHAVLMLIDNLGPAFRISLIPVAAFFVIVYLLTLVLAVPLDRAGHDPGVIGPFAILAAILILMGGVTLFCLVAVAWHRYVLVEEIPGSLGPRWNWPEMWLYFKATLRVMFGTVLVAIAGGFALAASGGVIGTDPMTSPFILPIFSLFLMYFSLRISLVLPAAAIGEQMSIWTSWKTSGPFAWAVLVAMVLVNLLVSIPTILVGTQIGGVLETMSYFVFSGWLQVMLSVSLLTALYGHIVQQRPLR